MMDVNKMMDRDSVVEGLTENYRSPMVIMTESALKAALQIAYDFGRGHERDRQKQESP